MAKGQNQLAITQVPITPTEMPTTITLRLDISPMKVCMRAREEAVHSSDLTPMLREPRLAAQLLRQQVQERTITKLLSSKMESDSRHTARMEAQDRPIMAAVAILAPWVTRFSERP